MTATTLTQPVTTATTRPRRRRARLAGIATAVTSSVYLAASAAGVDFMLTDSQSPQGHHLILPEIAVFTLVFAGLGWGALAAR
jgi:formylmethanofuran:tetrahydromethanopterin formyltransferase